MFAGNCLINQDKVGSEIQDRFFEEIDSGLVEFKNLTSNLVGFFAKGNTLVSDGPKLNRKKQTTQITSKPSLGVGKRLSKQQLAIKHPIYK